MVALNEKFSHSGLLASEWRVSPHEIDAFDFTKRSEEVRGGSVANFGGAGFRGLSDAPPLRRRSAAPVNQSDPESELHYVRNRTYNPARYTVLRQELKSPGRPGRASKKIAVLREIQRDPIGYSGGINLYDYLGGRAVADADPYGKQPNIIIGAGIGFFAACAISGIGGFLSGKSACQIARDCVCHGLGGAIAGGTLAGFPTIAGGCLGAAMGSIAAAACESLWHCAGDPPGRNPLGDPCEWIKAGLGTAAGCFAGYVADLGAPADELNKRLLGLLGSIFGLDCVEAEKC